MKQKFGGDSPCQLGVVKPDTQKKTQQGKGVRGQISQEKNLMHLGVSKNRGKTPKMDGENNGKPYQN